MMSVDVAIVGSRRAEHEVKKTHDMGAVVSNIAQDMRFVLSQSTFLHTMLRSLSCCQGRCAHQNILSILLPDTSYTHLLKVSTFLYTGCLKCSESDREPILSLLELLGLGRDISVDTSAAQEHVTEDEDDEDITFDITSNGDDDSMESLSSPSHSGGITSPEVDRTQDFETDSDDSSEGANFDIEDPYQFIASPVSRGIGHKKKRGKSSEPIQPVGSGRDKKCKNCKLRVSAVTFKKHIVTHMYDKWPEVGPDDTLCNLCDKTLQGQKYLINHLATVHHQLEEKLAADGETVESYEMVIEEEIGEDSVDTVTNNLVQEMELESSVLFPEEENGPDFHEELDQESRDNEDNDSVSTVPCSPRNCDDSFGGEGEGY